MIGDHSWIFPVLHQINNFCLRVGEREAGQHLLKAWDAIPNDGHTTYTHHTRFNWVTICTFANVENTLVDIAEYLELNNLLVAREEVCAARAKIMALNLPRGFPSCGD